jgi:hypothetical protein
MEPGEEGFEKTYQKAPVQQTMHTKKEKTNKCVYISDVCNCNEKCMMHDERNKVAYFYKIGYTCTGSCNSSFFVRFVVAPIPCFPCCECSCVCEKKIKK